METVCHTVSVSVVVQIARTRLAVPTIVVELTDLVTVPTTDVEVVFNVCRCVEVTVEALRSTVIVVVDIETLSGFLERIEEQNTLAVAHEVNLLLS